MKISKKIKNEKKRFKPKVKYKKLNTTNSSKEIKKIKQDDEKLYKNFKKSGFQGRLHIYGEIVENQIFLTN